ncbi:MAG: glycosyltransferase [Bacteroidota bacterium]
MKRVLILAHDFPPFQSIGAKRPASWLRHFKANGLYPVVVTRHWNTDSVNYEEAISGDPRKEVSVEETEQGTIIRVPYQPDWKDWMILRFGMNRFVLLRKMISFLSLYLRFFSRSFDPTHRIEKTAAYYLKHTRCDLILATGEPFILFSYAARLSRQFSVPWVADYRDGWTSNQSKEHRSLTARLLNRFYRVVEQYYLRRVCLITTAAPSYAESLAATHPSKKIEVVYNGYESEVLPLIQDIDSNADCFEIAYAGTLYSYQQLEMFLEAYQQFVMECQPRVRLTFFGLSFYPEMVQRVTSFPFANDNMRSAIHFTKRLDYLSLMKRLREAHVMLLLSNEGVNWLSAKVFDYLAVNRKILLVKNDKGVLESILKKSNAGVPCSSVAETLDFLKTQYAAFLQTGKLQHETKSNTFYSRAHQAMVMANHLHTLCEDTVKVLNPKFQN